MAKVIRAGSNGHVREIKARELVPGDIVEISGWLIEVFAYCTCGMMLSTVFHLNRCDYILCSLTAATSFVFITLHFILASNTSISCSW